MSDYERAVRDRISGWSLRALLLFILFLFGVWMVGRGLYWFRETVFISVPPWMLIPTGLLLCGVSVLGILYSAVRTARLQRIARGPLLGVWDYTEQEWWLMRRENPYIDTGATSEWINRFVVIVVLFDLLILYSLFFQPNGITDEYFKIVVIMNAMPMALIIFSPLVKEERTSEIGTLEPGVVITPEGVILGEEEYAWDLSRLRPEYGEGWSWFRRVVETRIFPPLLLEQASLVTNGQLMLHFYFLPEAERAQEDPEDLLYGTDYISLLVPKEQQEVAEQVRAFFGGNVVNKEETREERQPW
jgi:hypothetical protein